MLNKRFFLPGLFFAASSSVLAQPTGNLSSHLNALQAEYQAHSASGKAFTSTDTSVQLFQNQYVAVDISLKNTLTQANIDTLKTKLTTLGMTQISQYKMWLTGIMPIYRLSALGQQAEISWVSSNKAVRRGLGVPGGLAYDAADPAMFTDVVRKQYEVDGSGVIIGVLSDSYNCLNSAAADISSGDLPASVKVLKENPFCKDGATDEGRAMMQLIHAVAPGAQLMFYTASVSAIDFALGIQTLSKAGAKIIVDDVGYFTLPFFQPDPIAQAVNDVKAQGVSYFSAAGNNARLSYEQTYTEGLVPFSQDKAHDFGKASGGASDFYQKITLPPNQKIHITLQWDDPAEISGGKTAKTDLDIFLLDKTKNKIISSSQDTNIGHNPVESIGVNFTSIETQYYLYISHRAGPAPSHIKYIIVGPTADWPATPVSGVLQLKVAVTNGVATLVMPDSTPLTGGTAVIVSPFITGPNTIEIGNAKYPLFVDTNGQPSIKDGNDIIPVGPGTNHLIYFVPTGFTAGISPTGIVLYPSSVKKIPVSIDQYATYSSTIVGQPNAAGAIAVGAMSYDQTPWFGIPFTQSKIESFSSAGGTPMLFDKAGNRLTTPLRPLKPEIIAPDNTDTTFFGTDTDLNGLPNFQGTSAAAPHAAAMAALLLNAYPYLKPDDIYHAMTKGSLDLPDPAGITETPPITQACALNSTFNWATGCGLIQADMVFTNAQNNKSGVFLTLTSLNAQISAGVQSTFQFRFTNLSAVTLVNVRLRPLVWSSYLPINTVDGCIPDDPKLAGVCGLGDVAPGDTKTVTVTATPTNNPTGELKIEIDSVSDTPMDLSNAHLTLSTPMQINPGDLNHDGCVDKTDWGLLFGRFRSGGAVLAGYDLTGDGKLGADDLTALEKLYSNPPSGNACR